MNRKFNLNFFKSLFCVTFKVELHLVEGVNFFFKKKKENFYANIYFNIFGYI